MANKLTTTLATVFSAAYLCVGFAAPASATLFHLITGDIDITFDPDSSSSGPMRGWDIGPDGQLGSQKFFYRIGSTGGETNVANLSPVLPTPQGPIGSNGFAFERGLITANDPIRVFVKYTLLGGQPGPGSASVIEEVSIKNISGNTIDLHWFESTDWDLDENSDGDVAQTTTAFGMQGIFQKDNSIESLVLVPQGSEPDRWQIDTFDNLVSNSIGELSDGSPSTLDVAFGTPIPLFGPNDVAHAFQWDRTLAADEIFEYTKFKILTVTVPEPGTLALFGLGLAGLGFARRKKMAA